MLAVQRTKTSIFEVFAAPRGAAEGVSSTHGFHAIDGGSYDMGIDPRTPVIIGVAQINQRVDRGEEVVEPVDLMARALRLAADDAGVPAVLAAASVVAVPRPLSWRYRDPGALVAERIGATAARTEATVIGGNYGLMLVNRASASIQRGEADVVMVTGAEAWRTRTAARRDGIELPWTGQDDDVAPAVDLGHDDPPMSHPDERARGIVHPIEVYPMYETALRGAAGRGPDDHRDRIAALWSRFSDVAADNPHAWIRQRYTPDEIRTPTAENRMIGFPYTKRMNSNNAVEQGAGVIICSVARAEALGVDRDRWVFPLSGADAHDHWCLSERADLHRSPALRLAGRDALLLAAIGIDDVAHVDLYSCFPSAVQIGASELGLSIERDLTVTGGMSFAGGPWNSYTLHGLATMVERLRGDAGTIGLCTGNGGFTTKHSIALLRSSPPDAGYRHASPQDEVDAEPRRAFGGNGSGRVTIEAYTVMHDREGRPARAPVAAQLADGRRSWGTVDDPSIMQEMTSDEFVGRAAHLDEDGHVQLA
jgi:acetyl-CoA C-acetyltransferase